MSKSGKHNTTYQLELLKDQICFNCQKNFEYQVNWNKTNFKKYDYAYYEIKTVDGDDHDASLDINPNQTTTYYLHYECLEPAICQYTNNEQQMRVNRQSVETIYQFDRFGQRLSKINYVKQISKILRKQALHLFSQQVKHLYKWDWSSKGRPNSWYTFKDTEQNQTTFDQLKSQFGYKNMTGHDFPEVNAESVGDLLTYGKLITR